MNHFPQNEKENLVDAFIYWWFHLCYKYWETCNKLHTLRKRFSKGYDWNKNYSVNCNKRFHVPHSFATFRVNYSPQNEKENLVDALIYWWFHLCHKLRNCNKRFHALHSFDTFRVKLSPQDEKENLVDVFIYWWFHLWYKYRDT